MARGACAKTQTRLQRKKRPVACTASADAPQRWRAGAERCAKLRSGGAAAARRGALAAARRTAAVAHKERESVDQLVVAVRGWQRRLSLLTARVQQQRVRARTEQRTGTRAL
jgi:hypothetical protein